MRCDHEWFVGRCVNCGKSPSEAQLGDLTEEVDRLRALLAQIRDRAYWAKRKSEGHHCEATACCQSIVDSVDKKGVK